MENRVYDEEQGENKGYDTKQGSSRQTAVIV